jgi:hypothetical protein
LLAKLEEKGEAQAEEPNDRSVDSELMVTDQIKGTIEFLTRIQ